MKFTILLTIIMLIISSTHLQSKVVDQIVASVNGEAITLSMVQDWVNAPWLEPEDTPQTYQEALEKLINHKLMLQEARKLGVDIVVSEKSLAREFTDISSRFFSRDKAEEVLRKRGINQETLEEYLIEKIMVREMINRKFKIFIGISDIDISSHFEMNRENFKIPEKVHINRLFFSISPDADKSEKETARQKAKKAYKEIKAGAKFSDYANQEKSSDYIAINQLPPVVASRVSQMEVGDISDVIETPIGFFIIKLNDHRPEREATLAEVREQIRERLIQEHTQEQLDEWLKSQRRKGDIRIKLRFEDS
ncbi:hypothetical protein GF312_09435 [Candidatus Poribacteria bacterium]|nr:hypothetical protein [Candidatus Poribacteria bacterium]